ncbi:hypothetical protein AWU67_10300 [Microterricola viridarii]|uniref:DNA 3'-5' helicase n=1 Tax=Microterricola viridarii TaxID=412690 RepID=A0A109QYU9_9MICO|nr:hypothetical protein AWU67_10300 [Microterricola viridarii]
MQRGAEWSSALAAAIKEQFRRHGWLTREFAAEWEQRRAAIGIGPLLDEPLLADDISKLRRSGSLGIHSWTLDLPRHIAEHNGAYLESELLANKHFFDLVEKSPLTPEQATAVVCFENRVLVVASAGSGKTSTMVAKAGFAVSRGLIAPEKILMLAFNAAAAAELRQRTIDRLAPLGIGAETISARTFHAFGLEIIGQATGRKPTLAPWLEGGGDLKRLGEIVSDLRAQDGGFRREWDFFRAVLARDYKDARHESEASSAAEAALFTTAKGEDVKSSGERLIADWLFFNGVDYVYERPYEIDTADELHGQYRPDFYYPAIGTYHEHWALDEQGQPPIEFDGYLDGIHWKRQLHKAHGTALLETTMAELWSGRALSELSEQLTRRGIHLSFNPDRPTRGEKVVENERLVATFRSFLTHAKSNRLSDEQLRAKLESERDGEVRFRDASFLSLFAKIRSEWQQRLAAEGCIDFEDMLNLSADHLEEGDWQSPYELVMVDEFQDASNARARLARALVAAPGRHLFTVGDDWQSINRFAGADISVMTRFESWFGPSEVLRLERTFRFPQSIADASSQFVLKNPEQITKSVLSAAAEHPPTFQVISVDKDDSVAPALRHWLTVLHKQIVSGQISQPHGRPVSVFVLGRYRHQDKYAAGLNGVSELIDVRFMTIHASKGAEADYIVIPGMVSGKWGFPSTIPTDPVLRLAMPDAETFARAEERRLFYVALTRARRKVLLMTVEQRESRFLMELIADRGLIRTNAIGEPLESTVCPNCERAFMVRRVSKRGAFLGCQRYPRCKGTAPVPN